MGVVERVRAFITDRAAGGETPARAAPPTGPEPTPRPIAPAPVTAGTGAWRHSAPMQVTVAPARLGHDLRRPFTQDLVTRQSPLVLRSLDHATPDLSTVARSGRGSSDLAVLPVVNRQAARPLESLPTLPSRSGPTTHRRADPPREAPDPTVDRTTLLSESETTPAPTSRETPTSHPPVGEIDSPPSAGRPPPDDRAPSILEGSAPSPSADRAMVPDIVADAVPDRAPAQPDHPPGDGAPTPNRGLVGADTRRLRVARSVAPAPGTPHRPTPIAWTRTEGRSAPPPAAPKSTDSPADAAAPRQAPADIASVDPTGTEPQATPPRARVTTPTVSRASNRLDESRPTSDPSTYEAGSSSTALESAAEPTPIDPSDATAGEPAMTHDSPSPTVLEAPAENPTPTPPSLDGPPTPTTPVHRSFDIAPETTNPPLHRSAEEGAEMPPLHRSAEEGAEMPPLHRSVEKGAEMPPLRPRPPGPGAGRESVTRSLEPPLSSHPFEPVKRPAVERVWDPTETSDAVAVTSEPGATEASGRATIPRVDQMMPPLKPRPAVGPPPGQVSRSATTRPPSLERRLAATVPRGPAHFVEPATTAVPAPADGLESFLELARSAAGPDIAAPHRAGPAPSPDAPVIDPGAAIHRTDDRSVTTIGEASEAPLPPIDRAAGEVSDPSPAPPSAVDAGADQPSPELVDRIYKQVTRRLRTDLRLERERKGSIRHGG